MKKKLLAMVLAATCAFSAFGAAGCGLLDKLGDDTDDNFSEINVEFFQGDYVDVEKQEVDAILSNAVYAHPDNVWLECAKNNPTGMEFSCDVYIEGLNMGNGANTYTRRETGKTKIVDSLSLYQINSDGEARTITKKGEEGRILALFNVDAYCDGAYTYINTYEEEIEGDKEINKEKVEKIALEEMAQSEDMEGFGFFAFSTPQTDCLLENYVMDSDEGIRTSTNKSEYDYDAPENFKYTLRFQIDDATEEGLLKIKRIVEYEASEDGMSGEVQCIEICIFEKATNKLVAFYGVREQDVEKGAEWWQIYKERFYCAPASVAITPPANLEEYN